MERHIRLAALMGISITTLGLTACQTTGTRPDQTDTADHPSLTFAQAACGGCHAVQAPALSPNPASPSFADIANRPGLTRETLTAYLADAHNYPDVMDFDLDPAQSEGLVDYVLSLRSEGYRPRD